MSVMAITTYKNRGRQISSNKIHPFYNCHRVMFYSVDNDPVSSMKLLGTFNFGRKQFAGGLFTA